MAFTTKDFSTLVSEAISNVQGRAALALDTTIGSVLRALLESFSAAVMWLQAVALQVLALTRAATSSGADLDSWMADYGFTRLPAVAATGALSFARFTATAAASLPVGALVETQDGSQQFLVSADPNNAYYVPNITTAQPPQPGYIIPAGVVALTVAAQAVVPGSAGNVGTGLVNALAQALPGFDTVSNAAPFALGSDAETDAALRARFPLYLLSLSKATRVAVASAIEAINATAQFTITEDQTISGVPQPGYFYVVADNGSGNPDSHFLSGIASAIDAVRPLAVSFDVFAPTILTASVSMSVSALPGYLPTQVKAAVQTAVGNAINALGLGNTLYYTRLAAIAYGVEGVANVSNLLLNAATLDMAASNQQTIKAGTVTVN